MHILAAIMLAAQSVAADPALTAPPERISSCKCKAVEGAEAISIRGFAIDGEVRLDATGRNPLPRQATVFRVLTAEGVDARTPFKVWHLTAPDQCGVTFDYGKLYVVMLRKKGDDYETDRCLAHPAAAKEAEKAAE
ncbi:MAG: hypothetical protein VX640_05990 [Pseudomonadota bacterium]|nr:hypothetical protein [Pseudomonadota bacterium]